MDYQKHWSNIYETKAADNVSWYQLHPQQSLSYIQQTGIAVDEPIIDVGAGASTLVDHLVAAHYSDITLLDLSAEALAIARERVGMTAAELHWLVGDVTTVTLPQEHYAVWHDRAVFHFLTDETLKQRYVEQVAHAVKPGGHVIVATFALDGPQQCSGLDVAHYDATSLHGAFGSRFTLIDSTRETHQTPWGSRTALCVLLLPQTVAAFINIGQLNDAEVTVFKTPLDYPAMFALPGMQEMIGQQMSAMGSKMSESDFKVMMDMFQRMAKGMKFSMTQSVDLESNMFI